MSFDKTKIMRNAERFLSQGKIRAAINEYQRIVENDPKDFSTMNILGDLYVKNADKTQAVGCFTQVAEHYNKQGFAHKAIAIYNKISRIEPNSMEVSAKLAELYQVKGSFVEARMHYNSLADQYQRNGQMIEALTIWKQIAELDPHNTSIYLKIADVYQQEDQPDESAKAYTEAGLRLIEQESYEEALAAFLKALEIKKHYLRALKGLVKAQIGLGCADEAAKTLENILEEQPYNRDILNLLADCYIDMGDPAEAEKTIIKLVEQEPANYPRFLDLVQIYLKDNELDSATRILTISSEHLLVGGQSDDFLAWTNEILARNPEQIDAQRLLIRYHAWHRDEEELKKSLARMAELALTLEAVEDERDALLQLVTLLPHETAHAERLRAINIEHGFPVDQPEIESYDEPLKFEDFEAEDNPKSDGQMDGEYKEFDFTGSESSFVIETNNVVADENSNGNGDYNFYVENVEAAVGVDELPFVREAAAGTGELKLSDELKLQKEIESIEFYIAQGYKDLALKSLDALEVEFGQREEFSAFRLQLNGAPSVVDSKNSDTKTIESFDPPVAAISNNNGYEVLEELRSEFGLEEAESPDENDYETHYQTAVAYQEMGLMEDAIKEFQDAINCTAPDDGTRRFFKCSNLLGHCFMEKQMPNLALMWYKRCLEVSNLTDEEKQALYYELGNAYEVGGDTEKAVEFFEKLYAENVDYRDVSRRLEMFSK